MTVRHRYEALLPPGLVVGHVDEAVGATLPDCVLHDVGAGHGLLAAVLDVAAAAAVVVDEVAIVLRIEQVARLAAGRRGVVVDGLLGGRRLERGNGRSGSGGAMVAVVVLALLALAAAVGVSPCGGVALGGAPPSDLQPEMASSENVERTADRRRRVACMDVDVRRPAWACHCRRWYRVPRLTARGRVHRGGSRRTRRCPCGKLGRARRGRPSFVGRLLIVRVSSCRHLRLRATHRAGA